MSENYWICFENAKNKIDKDFFLRIGEWLTSKNFKYASLWVAGYESKVPLEEAVTRMPEGGNIMCFVRGQNGLSLHYLNDIILSSHPANFSDGSLIDTFVEVVKKLYLELKVKKVYSGWPSYVLSDATKESMKRDDHISWINIFSPETVKKVGKEKLKSVEAYRAEELEDGSFLLVLGKSPLDVSRERLDEVKRRLFK